MVAAILIMGIGFAWAEDTPELVKSEWVEATSIALAQDTVYYFDGNSVMEWEIGASSISGTGIETGADGAYSAEICAVVSDGQWPLAIVARYPLETGDALDGLELRFLSPDWNAETSAGLDLNVDSFPEWETEVEVQIESVVYQGEPSTYKVYLDNGTTKQITNPDYHGAMLYFTNRGSAYAADTATGEVKRIGDLGFGARGVAAYKGDMILLLQEDTKADSWKILVVDGQSFVMAEKASFPFDRWRDFGTMTYSSDRDAIYFACDNAIWKMTDFDMAGAVRIMDAPRSLNYISISRNGRLVCGDGESVYVSTLALE